LTLSYPEFENKIRALLKERGYTWPELMNNVWCKNRYVVRFSYEYRECASIEFGVATTPVNMIFPRLNDPWLGECLKHYSVWLSAIGLDPKEFVLACGGWEDGGLRTPDFDMLLSLFAATLTQVEELTSNPSFKRDALKRAP